MVLPATARLTALALMLLAPGAAGRKPWAGFRGRSGGRAPPAPPAPRQPSPPPPSPQPKPSCHTKEPSGLEREQMNLRARQRSMRPRREVFSPITVPIIFHVIHDGAKGNLTESEIAAQVAVLNDGFSGQGKPGTTTTDTLVRFTLATIERYDNANWYGQSCYNKDGEFKQAHTTEPERYLNIFTCSGAGYLGWSTLAEYYTETDPRHAVVVAADSLPGGSFNSYNLGDTLTHEVGHFFGLFHTFSNGQCSESSGDGVDDTPLQSDPTSGCPSAADSCPNDPGLDPVENFMDYSNDACMWLFSDGQITRMQDQIVEFKPILYRNSQGAPPTTTQAPPPTTTQAPPPTTTRAPPPTTTTQAPPPTTTTQAPPPTTTQAPPPTTTTQDDTTVGTTTRGQLCFTHRDCKNKYCNDRGRCGECRHCQDCRDTYNGRNCPKQCRQVVQEVCPPRSDQSSSTTSSTKSTTSSTSTTKFDGPGGAPSERSCSELGWTAPAGYPICAVGLINGKCPSATDFNSAVDTCESVGARICRENELFDGLIITYDSSRCFSHFKYRFWFESQGSAGLWGCNDGQHIAAGERLWQNKVSPLCRSPSSTYRVLCCADK